MYPIAGEISQQYLHTIRFQCSTFVEIELLFPLQETMYNYNKSVLSPYNPTKPAIHSVLRPEDDFVSNCGTNVKKSVSFDDVVHLIDEDNMVTYVDFDCGIMFFPESPTKMRQFSRERNYLSKSCEKHQCILGTDEHTCSVDEQHSSNNFLNPDNLWDMVPAAPMSLNHTNDTYSMFNQYPQPRTQQRGTDSYPVFSSLRAMDSKRERLRVRFAFFQRNYFPDGRVNESCYG